MGKKSAHTGMSPKDISVNAMDKFIARNDRKKELQVQRVGRYKDDSLPIDIWPLKDQLEYFDQHRDSIRFNQTYPSYSIWRDAVMDASGVYPSTFITFILPHKELMRSMYESQTSVREAVSRIRSVGVY